MSKKKFSEGINAILGEKETLRASSGEKKIQTLKGSNQSAEKRATFIIDKDLLEKLKAVAFWERENIKKILNDAISEYIERKGKMFIEEALMKFREKKS